VERGNATAGQSVKSIGQTWAIVLAAGEGARAPSSRDAGPSLLGQALERAARVTQSDRICVVVAAEHRREISAELQELNPANVIVQPANRGTGIDILLPLLHVIAVDPEARIVLLPSYHYVADESLLADALRRAIQVANLQRHKIILLGITPDASDAGLGYVVPGPVNGPGTLAVLRFVENPPPELAMELIAGGALWNTFIVAADASTLLTLFTAHIPEVCTRLRSIGPRHTAAEVYEGLPCVDFSHQILASSESILRVLPVGR
jgi:mannose-1-phosphate guanylyltransferase